MNTNDTGIGALELCSALNGEDPKLALSCLRQFTLQVRREKIIALFSSPGNNEADGSEDSLLEFYLSCLDNEEKEKNKIQNGSLHEEQIKDNKNNNIEEAEEEEEEWWKVDTKSYNVPFVGTKHKKGDLGTIEQNKWPTGILKAYLNTSSNAIEFVSSSSGNSNAFLPLKGYFQKIILTSSSSSSSSTKTNHHKTSFSKELQISYLEALTEVLSADIPIPTLNAQIRNQYLYPQKPECLHNYLYQKNSSESELGMIYPTAIQTKTTTNHCAVFSIATKITMGISSSSSNNTLNLPAMNSSSSNITLLDDLFRILYEETRVYYTYPKKANLEEKEGNSNNNNQLLFLKKLSLQIIESILGILTSLVYSALPTQSATNNNDTTQKQKIMTTQRIIHGLQAYLLQPQTTVLFQNKNNKTMTRHVSPSSTFRIDLDIKALTLTLVSALFVTSSYYDDTTGNNNSNSFDSSVLLLQHLIGSYQKASNESNKTQQLSSNNDNKKKRSKHNTIYGLGYQCLRFGIPSLQSQEEDEDEKKDKKGSNSSTPSSASHQREKKQERQQKIRYMNAFGYFVYTMNQVFFSTTSSTTTTNSSLNIRKKKVTTNFFSRENMLLKLTQWVYSNENTDILNTLTILKDDDDEHQVGENALVQKDEDYKLILGCSDRYPFEDLLEQQQQSQESSAIIPKNNGEDTHSSSEDEDDDDSSVSSSSTSDESTSSSSSHDSSEVNIAFFYNHVSIQARRLLYQLLSSRESSPFLLSMLSSTSSPSSLNNAKSQQQQKQIKTLLCKSLYSLYFSAYYNNSSSNNNKNNNNSNPSSIRQFLLYSLSINPELFSHFLQYRSSSGGNGSSSTTTGSILQPTFQFIATQIHFHRNLLENGPSVYTTATASSSEFFYSFNKHNIDMAATTSSLEVVENDLCNSIFPKLWNVMSSSSSSSSSLASSSSTSATSSSSAMIADATANNNSASSTNSLLSKGIQHPNALLVFEVMKLIVVMLRRSLQFKNDLLLEKEKSNKISDKEGEKLLQLFQAAIWKRLPDIQSFLSLWSKYSSSSSQLHHDGSTGMMYTESFFISMQFYEVISLLYQIHPLILTSQKFDWLKLLTTTTSLSPSQNNNLPNVIQYRILSTLVCIKSILRFTSKSFDCILSIIFSSSSSSSSSSEHKDKNSSTNCSIIKEKAKELGKIAVLQNSLSSMSSKAGKASLEEECLHYEACLWMDSLDNNNSVENDESMMDIDDDKDKEKEYNNEGIQKILVKVFDITQRNPVRHVLLTSQAIQSTKPKFSSSSRQIIDENNKNQQRDEINLYHSPMLTTALVLIASYFNDSQQGVLKEPMKEAESSKRKEKEKQVFINYISGIVHKVLLYQSRPRIYNDSDHDDPFISLIYFMFHEFTDQKSFCDSKMYPIYLYAKSILSFASSPSEDDNNNGDETTMIFYQWKRNYDDGELIGHSSLDHSILQVAIHARAYSVSDTTDDYGVESVAVVKEHEQKILQEIISCDDKHPSSVILILRHLLHYTSFLITSYSNNNENDTNTTARSLKHTALSSLFTCIRVAFMKAIQNEETRESAICITFPIFQSHGNIFTPKNTSSSSFLENQENHTQSNILFLLSIMSSTTGAAGAGAEKANIQSSQSNSILKKYIHLACTTILDSLSNDDEKSNNLNVSSSSSYKAAIILYTMIGGINNFGSNSTTIMLQRYKMKIIQILVNSVISILSSETSKMNEYEEKTDSDENKSNNNSFLFQFLLHLLGEEEEDTDDDDDDTNIHVQNGEMGSSFSSTSISIKDRAKYYKSIFKLFVLLSEVNQEQDNDSDYSGSPTRNALLRRTYDIISFSLRAAVAATSASSRATSSTRKQSLLAAHVFYSEAISLFQIEKKPFTSDSTSTEGAVKFIKLCLQYDNDSSHTATLLQDFLSYDVEMFAPIILSYMKNHCNNRDIQQEEESESDIPENVKLDTLCKIILEYNGSLDGDRALPSMVYQYLEKEDCFLSSALDYLKTKAVEEDVDAVVQNVIYALFTFIFSSSTVEEDDENTNMINENEQSKKCSFVSNELFNFCQQQQQQGNKGKLLMIEINFMYTYLSLRNPGEDSDITMKQAFFQRLCTILPKLLKSTYRYLQHVGVVDADSNEDITAIRKGNKYFIQTSQVFTCLFSLLDSSARGLFFFQATGCDDDLVEQQLQVIQNIMMSCLKYGIPGAFLNTSSSKMSKRKSELRYILSITCLRFLRMLLDRMLAVGHSITPTIKSRLNMMVSQIHELIITHSKFKATLLQDTPQSEHEAEEERELSLVNSIFIHDHDNDEMGTTQYMERQLKKDVSQLLFTTTAASSSCYNVVTKMIIELVRLLISCCKPFAKKAKGGKEESPLFVVSPSTGSADEKNSSFPLFSKDSEITREIWTTLFSVFSASTSELDLSLRHLFCLYDDILRDDENEATMEMKSTPSSNQQNNKFFYMDQIRWCRNPHHIMQEVEESSNTYDDRDGILNFFGIDNNWNWVIEAIDINRIQATLTEFPIWDTMVTKDEANNNRVSSERREDDDLKKSTYCNYGPGFLLPMILKVLLSFHPKTTLSTESLTNQTEEEKQDSYHHAILMYSTVCHRLSSKGCISLALASLSCYDTNLRKTSICILNLFLQGLKTTQSQNDLKQWKERPQLLMLLSSVQRGFIIFHHEEENHEKREQQYDEKPIRLNPVAALFLAHSSFILQDPSDSLYSTINKFFLKLTDHHGAFKDLNDLPAFISLFCSSSFPKERLWSIQTLLQKCVLDSKDYQVCHKRHVPDLILTSLLSSSSSLLSSSMLSHNNNKKQQNHKREEIEALIKVMIQFLKCGDKAAYMHLVDKLGLLSWLRQFILAGGTSSDNNNLDLLLTKNTAVEKLTSQEGYDSNKTIHCFSIQIHLMNLLQEIINANNRNEKNHTSLFHEIQFLMKPLVSLFHSTLHRIQQQIPSSSANAKGLNIESFMKYSQVMDLIYAFSKTMKSIRCILSISDRNTSLSPGNSITLKNQEEDRQNPLGHFNNIIDMHAIPITSIHTILYLYYSLFCKTGTQNDGNMLLDVVSCFVYIPYSSAPLGNNNNNKIKLDICMIYLQTLLNSTQTNQNRVDPLLFTQIFKKIINSLLSQKTYDKKDEQEASLFFMNDQTNKTFDDKQEKEEELVTVLLSLRKHSLMVTDGYTLWEKCAFRLGLLSLQTKKESNKANMLLSVNHNQPKRVRDQSQAITHDEKSRSVKKSKKTRD